MLGTTQGLLLRGSIPRKLCKITQSFRPARPSLALHPQTRRTGGLMARASLQPEGSSEPAVTTLTPSGSPAPSPTDSLDPAADLTATATATDPPAWRWEESDDAVRAYGSLVGLLLIGNLPFLHSSKLADLPYFVGLALVTIYIGAHRGLTTRQRQQISIKEGILAPVAASVSLFGFYLLIKYVPDFSPAAFLNAYFWALGSFAIGGAAVPLLRKVCGPLGEKSLSFTVPEGLLIDEDGGSITKAELAPTDIAAVALALGLASAELASGHTNFTLNNLVACLVATDILQLIGPRSFRTAGLLLLGLLAYDVFWVFGSPKVIGDNVMLTVATSDLVAGPTRILFPRVAGGGSTAEAAAAAFPFSLLGLGDIAIPGLLACLALRYDASRSTNMYARAVAAAEAITSTLASLDPGASSRQIADATAAAAETAYDKVADREARQRAQSLGDGAATDAADGAAGPSGRQVGASIVRNVAAAAAGGAGGSSSLGSPRGSLGTSPGAGLAAALAGRGSNGTGKGQQEEAAASTDTAGGGAGGAQGEGRMGVSEGVLQQRTYFSPVMVAYVVGLVCAFVANDITGLGQPALLYIVPATLGAVALTGVSRRELGRLWAFTDVPSFGVAVTGEKEGKEGKERLGKAGSGKGESN